MTLNRSFVRRVFFFIIIEKSERERKCDSGRKCVEGGQVMCRRLRLLNDRRSQMAISNWFLLFLAICDYSGGPMARDKHLATLFELVGLYFSFIYKIRFPHVLKKNRDEEFHQYTFQKR